MNALFAYFDDLIVIPLLTGLASGGWCLASCLPFVAPIMVEQERPHREQWNVIGQFLLGRLVGYIGFGAVAGFLGERIADGSLDLVITLAMMVLSLLMILQAIGLIRADRLSVCMASSSRYRSLPIVMGFLMGANVCPPFLLALTSAFKASGMWYGVNFFFWFFVGTSFYFVPAVFLGRLGKYREFRLVGRIAALFVGGLFLLQGSIQVYRVVLQID